MATSDAVHEAVLNVPNINCVHCVKTITRELKGMDSVVAVQADVDSREVTVQYLDDALGDIKARLADIGYPAAA